MPLHNAFPVRLSVALFTAALGACGGGGSSAPAAVAGAAAPVAAASAAASAPAVPASAAAAAALTGTVAVGAPITDGKLRILDATGAVVAENVAIAADGRYAAVTLTGSAPWRLEACGYAGPNWQCLYSVAQAGGTVNVTPLTSALVVLASGRAPDALMNGSASGLDAAAVAGAQTTLRTGLAPVLADAGVGTSFDLIGGTLAAGSRTGYDRVLDAVGVRTGVDAAPFVQVSPRLGSGNLYLEAGAAPAGSISTAGAAAALPLAGLQTLFDDMTAAIASAQSCANPNTGLAAQLSPNARMSMGGGEPLAGAAAVAAGLCEFLAGGDGEPARLGSRFMSPTLGRCDFNGAAPVCAVSFALQLASGGVEDLTGGMAVSYEGRRWRFLGDRHAVAITASARVQRERRIDGTEPVDSYARAVAFEIPAIAGLACARVSQRDAAGSSVALALYKRHGRDAERLSLWTADGVGQGRSLDPAAGATRSSDDSWLALPQGTEGDAAVRNFFRGGRSVTVSLYGDAGCSAALSVAGSSSFEVDLEGVPPVWSAMPSLPWPDLTPAARAAFSALELPAGGTAELAVAWRFTGAPLGVNGATVCSNLAACGQGGSGRLGEQGVLAGTAATTVTVRAGSQPFSVGPMRTLSLYGRTGDGVGLQSNLASCPQVAAGSRCQ